jgi:hypothetical protein
MSQSSSTNMPGTWKKAINSSSPHLLLYYILANVLADSGLNNGLITGQGQKAIVTCRGDNNTGKHIFLYEQAIHLIFVR